MERQGRGAPGFPHPAPERDGPDPLRGSGGLLAGSQPSPTAPPALGGDGRGEAAGRDGRIEAPRSWGQQQLLRGTGKPREPPGAEGGGGGCAGRVEGQRDVGNVITGAISAWLGRGHLEGVADRRRSPLPLPRVSLKLLLVEGLSQDLPPRPARAPAGSGDVCQRSRGLRAHGPAWP